MIVSPTFNKTIIVFIFKKQTYRLGMKIGTLYYIRKLILSQIFFEEEYRTTDRIALGSLK